MDPQPTNSPDLHMPPPNVGQDNLTSEPEQSGGVISRPQFSDTTDTILVNPRESSPPPVTQASPLTDTPQDDVGGAGTDDDDASLDEEWIQKAKTIVDQTKADPYQQSREISKVKANYLKTHYNKDIKVADDQSL
jgi:hypothetical protein